MTNVLINKSNLYRLLNFLSKKVLEYQQKKLSEAENNLQYHISKKQQLQELSSSENMKHEIEKIEKLIKIWENNVEKIKKEIKNIQEK